MNETCMIRPFLINLNTVEFKYYSFMIRLDKCNRSCNSVNDLSMKICVPSKTKHASLKVLYVITKEMKLKY